MSRHAASPAGDQGDNDDDDDGGGDRGDGEAASPCGDHPLVMNTLQPL